MEPLYDFQQTEKLEPYVYNTELRSLFTVPRDGAVGTNDLNNAITVINFKKDRYTTDTYFKNAFAEIGGGITTIPPVSQDVIGFGQVRGFSLFDLRRKTFEDFRICPSIEETIERIAIADAKKLHFIFQIKSYNKNSNDHNDYVTLLRLMDLSGKEPRLIKEVKKEPGVSWSVHSEKLFIFFEDKMQVFTTHFEPAYHPLQDLFARNKGKIRAWRIHIHPTLPFAIIVNNKIDNKVPTYVVSWAARGKGDMIATLFNSTREFSFSPDGKWVVFKRLVLGDRVSYHTYLAPISEKYPNFIGTPIKLYEGEFRDYSVAWTTKPTSFVGRFSRKLRRWELTTAAHPESTKPDFHEFIVERDLEKLKKEKKQGLGEK